MNRSTGRRLPVTLTQEDVEALFSRINTSCTTGLRNRALLEVMLGAGLRVSEALALLGRDVDLTRGEIRVNLGKGGKDRVVPINGQTLAWLQAWHEKREALGLSSPRRPFFPGLRTGPTGQHSRRKGEALKPRYVQALMQTLAEAAGIAKRVSPHTLRHTYASRMLDRGLNIREVQELLGHSSVQTTQIYTHVNPEQLRRKVQALDEPSAPDPVAELAKALSALPQEQRQALAKLLQ